MQLLLIDGMFADEVMSCTFHSVLEMHW